MNPAIFFLACANSIFDISIWDLVCCTWILKYKYIWKKIRRKREKKRMSKVNISIVSFWPLLNILKPKGTIIFMCYWPFILHIMILYTCIFMSIQHMVIMDSVKYTITIKPVKRMFTTEQYTYKKAARLSLNKWHFLYIHSFKKQLESSRFTYI